MNKWEIENAFCFETMAHKLAVEDPSYSEILLDELLTGYYKIDVQEQENWESPLTWAELMSGTEPDDPYIQICLN